MQWIRHNCNYFFFRRRWESFEHISHGNTATDVPNNTKKLWKIPREKKRCRYWILSSWMWKRLQFFLLRKSLPPGLRSHHMLMTSSVSVPSSAILDSFEPVTLSSLQEAVSCWKSIGSPNDSLPPWLFKEVFFTVGPLILALLNSSLSYCVAPGMFKHAVVQPLIKKPTLDPLCSC